MPPCSTPPPVLWNAASLPAPLAFRPAGVQVHARGGGRDMSIEQRVKEQFPGLLITLVSVLVGLVFADLVNLARSQMELWPLSLETTSSAPAFSHVRQAYFGRRVTITRSFAGTLSRRSEVSSPMICRAPPQHGQALLSGSMTIS